MSCSQVPGILFPGTAVERAGALKTFVCYTYLAPVFQKSAILLPVAPTVETSATDLRFFSRCPRRHLVRAGLAIAAATAVFLDRAAEEQSTFYTDCWCYRATYELPNDNWYHTSSCSLYSSKKCTWLQYKKRQIQAPGTTFSTFSDEVRLEGGHGNCSRFATLTGVHQGAHICLAKLWFKGKVRSYET